MQSNSGSSMLWTALTLNPSIQLHEWILQLKLRWKPGSGALLPLSATKMQKISQKIALNETYRFNVSASVFCQKSTSALQNAKFSRVSLWTQRQEKRKSTPLSLSLSLSLFMSCSFWFVLARCWALRAKEHRASGPNTQRSYAERSPPWSLSEGTSLCSRTCNFQNGASFSY